MKILFPLSMFFVLLFITTQSYSQATETFVPKENLIAFLPEEEWERFENDYSCDNCGGGFAKEEIDFDVNDQDLCKNCNHKSFNDAPYGEDED